jgi:hypothetical protein
MPPRKSAALGGRLARLGLKPALVTLLIRLEAN